MHDRQGQGRRRLRHVANPYQASSREEWNVTHGGFFQISRIRSNLNEKSGHLFRCVPSLPLPGYNFLGISSASNLLGIFGLCSSYPRKSASVRYRTFGKVFT